MKGKIRRVIVWLGKTVLLSIVIYAIAIVAIYAMIRISLPN